MRKQTSVPRFTFGGAVLILVGIAGFALSPRVARADKSYYFYVSGYAGTQKVGPFSTQEECDKNAQAERDQGYKVDACTSEGSDSSSTPSSDSVTPTSVPSTPAEALIQGVQNGMAAAEAEREKQKAQGRAAYRASAQSGQSFYQSETQRQDSLLRQEDDAARARTAEREAQQAAEAAADRADTLGKIKDDSGDLLLKDESTPFFGGKVTTASEAASVIDARKPAGATNDLSTAWKRLNCASDIAHHVLADARKMDAAGASERELDDISFLAQQSINALSGATVDVTCSPAPAPPSVKAPDLSQISPRYKQVLTRAVDDAKRLYEIQQAEQAAQKKLDAAKAASAVSSTSKQSSNGGGADSDAIAKAVAEQNAWRAKDQANINAIYAQQKQMQQQNSDALAALRAAQLQLNKENSEKVSVEDDLNKLSGELPQN